jgi:hypothetical protein
MAHAVEDIEEVGADQGRDADEHVLQHIPVAVVVKQGCGLSSAAASGVGAGRGGCILPP